MASSIQDVYKIYSASCIMDYIWNHTESELEALFEPAGLDKTLQLKAEALIILENLMGIALRFFGSKENFPQVISTKITRFLTLPVAHQEFLTKHSTPDFKIYSRQLNHYFLVQKLITFINQRLKTENALLKFCLDPRLLVNAQIEVNWGKRSFFYVLSWNRGRTYISKKALFPSPHFFVLKREIE